MPRRSRKKSCQGKKAPLTFTESPVNKQWNIPSPVCCVHHPLTARVVPVEDFNNSTWCSPQFGHNTSDGKRLRRGLRVKKSAHSSNVHCTCGGVSLPADYAHKITKFKPLEFVGDKILPETVIEDISVEETSDQENDIRPPQKFHTEVKSTGQNGNNVLKRKVKRISTKLHVQRNSCNKSVNDCQNVSKLSPQVMTSFVLGNISVETPPHTEQGPVQQLFKDLTENMETVKSKQLPAKRLFSERNLSDYANNVGDIDTLGLCDPDEEDDYHQRLRPRHVLVKYFDTTKCDTPTNLRKRCPSVLVTDTPEADYGLPIRLRRLRKH